MCGERAGERDVVDVVARLVRQRAVLAPAGHAGVDQPRVARRRQTSGPRPSRSATPGRKPSTSTSASAARAQHQRDAVGMLEVEPAERRPRDRHVERRQARRAPGSSRPGRLVGPVDAEHVGAQVGEHHRAERRRADARRARRPGRRRAARSACAQITRSRDHDCRARSAWPSGSRPCRPASARPGRPARAPRGTL